MELAHGFIALGRFSQHHMEGEVGADAAPVEGRPIGIWFWPLAGVTRVTMEIY